MGSGGGGGGTRTMHGRNLETIDPDISTYNAGTERVGFAPGMIKTPPKSMAPVITLKLNLKLNLLELNLEQVEDGVRV